jgi:hypothetical protein
MYKKDIQLLCEYAKRAICMNLYEIVRLLLIKVQEKRKELYEKDKLAYSLPKTSSNQVITRPYWAVLAGQFPLDVR